MKKKTTKPRKQKIRSKVYVKKNVNKDHTPEFNMNHPEIKDTVEYAFSCGGKDYFRFKDEREIPAGRYVHVDAFLKEHEIRMSIPTLQAYIQAMKEALTVKGGEIDIQKAIIVLWKMETRTNLAFSVDTIKRLASVIFFDETENLSLYDSDYGQKKITLWELHKNIAFFLQTPIKELLGLQNITETSLQNFIQNQTEILKALTSTPSTSSGGVT